VPEGKRSSHGNLIAWAKERGLFVRVDRATPWGNPFVIGSDGDRAAVIAQTPRRPPVRPARPARASTNCVTRRLCSASERADRAVARRHLHAQSGISCVQRSDASARRWRVRCHLVGKSTRSGPTADH
jgi:hypothetical protein